MEKSSSSKKEKNKKLLHKDHGYKFTFLRLAEKVGDDNPKACGDYQVEKVDLYIIS